MPYQYGLTWSVGISLYGTSRLRTYSVGYSWKLFRFVLPELHVNIVTKVPPDNPQRGCTEVSRERDRKVTRAMGTRVVHAQYVCF